LHKNERDRLVRQSPRRKSARRTNSLESALKIHDYQIQVLENFSTDDITHSPHDLLKLLDEHEVTERRIKLIAQRTE
jgi:hypothetical protein